MQRALLSAKAARGNFLSLLERRTPIHPHTTPSTVHDPATRKPTIATKILPAPAAGLLPGMLDVSQIVPMPKRIASTSSANEAIDHDDRVGLSGWGRSAGCMGPDMDRLLGFEIAKIGLC
jgi:hypothetical protein